MVEIDATDLIDRLKYLIKQHGTTTLRLDVYCHGLQTITEVDFVEEDDALVIWVLPVEELNESEMLSLLKNDPLGREALGKAIVSWLCKKLKLRLGEKTPHHKVIEKGLADLAMKTAGLSVGTDQIFIDAFNGLLASQSEVFTFLDELVSAGIIKADGKERWRWSYQIFRNGFAALGADNGVNTL